MTEQQKIEQYLKQHVEEFVNVGDLQMEKFSGGQSNPTYKLSLNNDERAWVLRCQPTGNLLKSAHAVDREYKVMNALSGTNVPVPRMVHLCTDVDVIGRMFYVMEFMHGRIFWNASVPEVTFDDRGVMYDEMNKVLASLHSVDLAKAGLLDYGKPGNYFDRQFSRWSQQYRASEMGRVDSMEKLMTWLESRIPEDDGRVALVHGDFRLDNMMFAPEEPRVIALLDWELSTLGHPYADLAYQCMQWYMPHDAEGKPGLSGLDRSELNIPSEKDYVGLYCERMGVDKIDDWEVILAFSFFRLAAIVQGVAKRGVDGNASSDEALKMGEMVEPLAQAALQVIA